MRHLDLFSGIGGFALAASWVWGAEHKIVSFCEIDPFCQKVLKKHWPDVPIHSDIKTLKGDEFGTVDLISGGFPCQPFSHAGKRKGREDNRYLWPEMLRVIKETAPRWVILENVPGLLSISEGMVFEGVCADLEREGYEVWPFCIPACAVNAPHRRDRVWIVANLNSSGSQKQGTKLKASGVRQFFQTSQNSISGRNRGRGDGDQAGGERSLQVAGSDSYVADTTQQLFNRSGRAGQTRREKSSNSNQPCPDSDRINGNNERFCSGEISQHQKTKIQRGNAPDTGHQRLQGRKRPGTHEKRPAPHGSATERNHAWDEPWIEAATRLCGVDARVSNRLDRLKALGNAIVPQVVVPIMQAIKELESQ